MPINSDLSTTLRDDHEHHAGHHAGDHEHERLIPSPQRLDGREDLFVNLQPAALMVDIDDGTDWVNINQDPNCSTDFVGSGTGSTVVHRQHRSPPPHSPVHSFASKKNARTGSRVSGGFMPAMTSPVVPQVAGAGKPSEQGVIGHEVAYRDPPSVKEIVLPASLREALNKPQFSSNPNLAGRCAYNKDPSTTTPKWTMEQGIKVGAARPVPRTITKGHRHTHDDFHQTYDHSIDQEAMLIEKRSLPLAISGPIGSGKGALARAVLDDPQLGSLFAQPIRHTSRRPREGELHSVDFYFVSKTEFEQLIAEDAFAEWSLGDKASLVGAANQYTGTTTVSIARTTQKGLVPLLQLDMSAFLSIVANQATMDVRAVFLTSDKISLAQRINKRTDAAHAVAQVEESQDDIVRGLKLEKDIDLILNNDVGDEDESLKVLLNALHTYYN